MCPLQLALVVNGLKSVILFPEDRELLESDGWLNDKHINAAQTLLKVQHSHNYIQLAEYSITANRWLSSTRK